MGAWWLLVHEYTAQALSRVLDHCTLSRSCSRVTTLPLGVSSLGNSRTPFGLFWEFSHPLPLSVRLRRGRWLGPPLGLTREGAAQIGPSGRTLAIGRGVATGAPTEHPEASRLAPDAPDGAGRSAGCGRAGSRGSALEVPTQGPGFLL